MTRTAYPAADRPYCGECMQRGSATKAVGLAGSGERPLCGHHRRQLPAVIPFLPFTVITEETTAMTTTLPTIPADDDLAALPVKTGLRPLAKAHGISYDSKTSKSDLVADLSAMRKAIARKATPAPAPTPTPIAPAPRGKGRDLGVILADATAASDEPVLLQEVAKAHGVSVGALTNRWKADRTEGVVAVTVDGRKAFARTNSVEGIAKALVAS